jgi:branched-chain amino acid transport system ATP-binding protein
MLLEASQLTVGYGGAPAITGVSIAVDAGEIVAVIGPNGAGKSTLINAIAGVLRHREGALSFDGVDLLAVPAHQVCRHGVALVPEGRRLFAGMTVDANLARVCDLFPVLGARRHQLAGTLSGGQQQMVAIGRALMAEPRLLLLDEPSLGLAPSVVADVFRVVRTIHDDGMSILLVEQNVGQALEVADRAYVLEEGRVVAAGLPAELLAQSRIREAYLGL